MNIFPEIIVDDIKAERSLGNPLRDEAARERRMNIMATFTNGNGFRTPPKSPRVNPSDGLTRGQRKRALRERTNAKIMEGRANG